MRHRCKGGSKMCTITTYSLMRSRYHRSCTSLDDLVNYPLIRMDYRYRLNLETKDKSTKYTDIYLKDYELKEKLYFPILRVLQEHLDYSIATIHNHVDTDELAYYRLPISLKNRFLKWLMRYNGCDIFVKFLFITDREGKLCVIPNVFVKFFLFKYKLKAMQPKEYILSKQKANELLKLLESLV